MLDVKTVNGDIILPEPVLREITKLQEFQITKQEMENEEKEIKEAIYKAMSENGIKSFAIDGVVRFTCIAPTVSKTLDKKKVTDLINDMGLDVEDYQKTSNKSGYVKVEYE